MTYPVQTQDDATVLPTDDLVMITHLIYGLHAFSLLVCGATLLGGFVGGIPSIVAVLLNYWKQEKVRGTWLESHFRWQIRTFWFAVLWVAIAFLFAITLIGIPLTILLFAIAGLWVLYRIVRGWWRLVNKQPLPI